MEGSSQTSESFSGAIQKVDLKPYIDEIELEMARIAKEGRPKTESAWEIELGRLQAILRDQSRRLANQLGMAGDPMILFMLMSGLISVSWAAFAIRKVSVDTNRPFEDTVAMMELLSQISNAASVAVDSASAYADIYKR